jgi:putative chitinase
MLNLNELKRIFPNAKYGYLEAIVASESDLAKAGITDNERRIDHFLSQGGAETGGFTIKEESGNYSAERLLKVFPKYFKSLAAARAYAGRPKAIFEKTYGGRLGNNLPGDGYKYRGRGIFQLTGKDAYKHYGDKLGIDLVANPDLASQPEISVKIAILYWSELGLNQWADKDDILAVSRGINGGDPKRNIQPNGMEHRRAWHAKLSRAPQFTSDGSLKEGDTGEQVLKLQSLLRAKGFAAGAIDGIFGANTRRAVVAFQDEAKLEGPRGIFQQAHWTALEAIPNVQAERQETTATDLQKQGEPIVTQATWLQRLLSWFGLGALLTGGVSEGASNFPALVTQYQPVIETLSPLFRFVASNGWLLAAVAALAGWLILRGVIKAAVRAYRHGDYQGPYKEVK